MSKDQIKALIEQTIQKEKPETTKQLAVLLQQNHSIPLEQTMSLLIELDNENRLRFTKEESIKPSSTRDYIFSKQASWYWTTILLASVTAIAVFTINGNGAPFAYFRYSTGIFFILFLPGFTLMKALFPEKVPSKTFSKDMDIIKVVALSFGMSLLVVPIVGLILNFSPWGIRLTPVILTMLSLIVVLATAAILREYRTKLLSIN